MIKANNKQLETINKRYNKVKEDIVIGTNYCCEGAEIIDFEVDDNGRVTMEVEINRLNSQWALRTRYQTRHPRLKPAEIDYLLGKTNDLE